MTNIIERKDKCYCDEEEFGAGYTYKQEWGDCNVCLIAKKKLNTKKLYEIPRGSRIKLETHNEKCTKLGDFVIFHHIDGMYSYCTIEDSNIPVHISAVQKVEKCGDYYKLVN